ncbi:TetR/AcrR family transcriptional regulator [Streptosporangiaceae bacterium NEAU-GS5]|nr:TetR/AcrR family transcriptional regulator [Streptosporangiaceae bacterium NEAU-GS5]
MVQAGTGELVEDGRSARKRRAIADAAAQLFYQKGYLGTSMDEIAALAAVSKQTVYKHFADKERLFTEIVLRTVDEADSLFSTKALGLRETDDIDRDMSALARWFTAWLMQPDVLRLRRLIIAEASRFPDLGRTWYERGFEQIFAILGDTLRHLADRGLLRIDDATLAANHLMALMLWVPVNRVMFTGDDTQFTAEDLDRYADAGAHAFLAAYKA